MILAILALTGSSVGMAQSAYLAGRCYVHLTDDAKVSVVRQLEGETEAPSLMKLYYKGVQDSRREPLTAAQCQVLIGDAEGATSP